MNIFYWYFLPWNMAMWILTYPILSPPIGTRTDKSLFGDGSIKEIVNVRVRKQVDANRNDCPICGPKCVVRMYF